MSCTRCPHHVRHGQTAKDGKTLMFSDLCGLKLRELFDYDPNAKKKGRGRTKINLDRKIIPRKIPIKVNECLHIPFPNSFDYFKCAIYQKTFCSQGLKNGVVPTKDIHFSETIANVSVTDLDYL